MKFKVFIDDDLIEEIKEELAWNRCPAKPSLILLYSFKGGNKAVWRNGCTEFERDGKTFLTIKVV